MDRSTPFYLVSAVIQTDTYGVQKRTETKKEVFGQINSVTASEFFEGGRNGLTPELRFSVFLYDYSGETVVEYDGKRYSVYRTYKARNDIMELYCERKGGTMNTPASVTSEASSNG